MFVPGGGSYYPAGTADADMDVPEAWTKATGAGVTVGIVDTGVLTTHPDLADQVATNAGETGTDALGPRQALQRRRRRRQRLRRRLARLGLRRGVPEHRRLRGRQHAGPDNDPQDNHGHGTHVAGTVAAQRDNNEGISGVAPGAKIMPLRALGANGSGTNIAIAEAFDYAGKMGLRVVNASLGGPGLDQTQLTAIQAHPNTLYVIAAGNDNVNNDVDALRPVRAAGGQHPVRRRVRRERPRAPRSPTTAPRASTCSRPARRSCRPTRRPRTRTCRARRWPARTRPASRRSCCRPRPGVERPRRQERDHGVHRREARPGRQVGHRRARQRRPGGHAARSAARRSTSRRPSITGTPRQGVALGASTGTWSPPGTSYGYVWQRSFDGGSTWTAIVGATGSIYTPGASDIGAKLRVTVTATNPYGVASATSAAVGPVASGAPVNTGAPVISGTPRRGQVLVRQLGLEPGRHVLHVPVAALDRRRHLDGDRRQRVELHAHDGRARGARARDGHGDQRLRAGLGDQRAGRAGRVGSARQHHAAGHHRHDAADASR